MTWYRFPIASLALISTLGCDSTAALCGANETRVGPGCVKTYEPASVKLNSVGFLPEHVKRATLSGGDSDGTFRVLRAGDSEVAYLGSTSEELDGSETRESGVRALDFSDFTEEGEFIVQAPGVGESPRFRIGRDVYTDVVRVLMLGLYGQRCGEAVSFRHEGQDFEHGECHTEDAWLDYYGKAEEKQPTLYGWHDAGDYGKYTNNGSFSLGMMLLAWQQFQPALERLTLEIPEQDGKFPDYLDECKFQLDWLLGMQLEDGSVADRVTTATFDGMVSPEGSTARRRLSPPTTTATGDFVAVLSRAAHAFEPYDAELAATYRDAAARGWAYLIATPEDTTPPDKHATRLAFTGGYWSPDQDDRAWAAAEYWELTGEAAAREAFETSVADARIGSYFDWRDLWNMGVFTYLLSAREDRNPEVVASLTERVTASAGAFRRSADDHPYGRPVDSQYWWGINGVIARTAMHLTVADTLAPDPANKDAIALGLDHLLGRNFYGRSYLTGIGHDPPKAPHHRPSQADSASLPWPGLLVGGPSEGTDALPVALAWHDDSEDYRSNEIAINWNAAMIYAAAALLPAD